MTLRVVVDTDVMAAGLSSAAGASRRLLLAVLDGEIWMPLSTPLLLEYETVLTRPARLAMAGVTAGEVMGVLDELAGICIPVAFDDRWRPQTRDPNDDLVLETAINGGAELVASFNGADMQAGARRFGMEVERPGAVARRIMT